MAAASTTQVLEFDLGQERYCVDIECVSQIVDRQEITPIPDAPAHVEGVTDLRGETTTVVNPTVLFDIEADENEDRIVVFDAGALDEESVIGWQIGTVHRVVDITPDDVEPSPVDGQAGIQGLIRRDGGFTIWVSPRVQAEQ